MAALTPAPASPGALDAQLARLRAPPRTGPLIVTILGDAVAPRGGSLWLGTLERVVAPFGVTPGGLRTALSRLVEDGWLARTRVGRLSFHRLGPRGEAAYADAARRIYAPALARWDGRFRLAVSPDPATRNDLMAAGWGAAGPDLLVGLDDPPAAAPDHPGIVLRAEAAPDGARALASRALASRAWRLDEVGEAYARFTAAFAPLDGALAADEEALPLRVLLAHAFRRVALRDPARPPALLPPPWAGAEARALAGRLYRALLPASEAWLDREGRAEGGPLPRPDGSLRVRFGGARRVTGFP